MPKLEYFLLADSFAIDRDSGEVSLFHVLSSLRVPTLPCTLPRLAAIACWLFAPEELEANREHQVAVRFLIPGRAEPLIERGHLASDTRVLLSTFEVTGATFEKAGDFVTELILDEQVCETHHVAIEVVASE